MGPYIWCVLFSNSPTTRQAVRLFLKISVKELSRREDLPCSAGHKNSGFGGKNWAPDRRQPMQLEEEKIKEEEEEVESVCSNQSSEMAPLTESELHLFKKLFHDQSKGIFQTRDKDINSKEMWIEILTEYNRRAQLSNEQPQQNWMDRSLAEQGCQQERDPILMEIFDPCDTCKKKVIVSPLSLLSEELRKQRGAVDVNLNQIFEFCETCKGKIPSFPTSMMTSSSGLGSRTFSSIGGEVEGRFVRPCIAPVAPLPVAPADHEQIKAAIDVLTAMGTKKLIDVQTLWKLAGHCSWGNLDLIMVLKSPATLEEKAELVKGYPLDEEKAELVKGYPLEG